MALTKSNLLNDNRRTSNPISSDWSICDQSLNDTNSSGAIWISGTQHQHVPDREVCQAGNLLQGTQIILKNTSATNAVFFDEKYPLINYLSKEEKNVVEKFQSLVSFVNNLRDNSSPENSDIRKSASDNIYELLGD